MYVFPPVFTVCSITITAATLNDITHPHHSHRMKALEETAGQENSFFSIELHFSVGGAIVFDQSLNRHKIVGKSKRNRDGSSKNILGLCRCGHTIINDFTNALHVRVFYCSFGPTCLRCPKRFVPAIDSRKNL